MSKSGPLKVRHTLRLSPVVTPVDEKSVHRSRRRADLDTISVDEERRDECRNKFIVKGTLDERIDF